MKIKKHSIFLLVGPSGCGKTTYCNQHLVPLLQKHGTTAHISSDSIRHQLLGDDHADKYGKRMLEVSGQAFSVLENLVDAHTTYPLNTEFVVVDTKGISGTFRDRIYEIAKNNQYNIYLVVFDYKNKDDYFKYAKGGSTGRDVRKLKTEMANLQAKKYSGRINVRGHDTSVAELEFEGDVPQGGLKVDSDNVLIVGDIHGCFYELLSLLRESGVQLGDQNQILSSPYDHIILVGDYLDKGPYIHSTTAFLASNIDHIIPIVGNHENFTIKYWEKPIDLDPEMLKKFFISALSDTELFRKSVQEIYNRSFHFVEGPSFIATHSPCQKKYLGKTTPKALRAQRNFVYRELGKYLVESTKFLYEEAAHEHKYHVFGHIPVKSVFRNKNKIGIDTGCVSGGNLTAVTFKEGKPNFVSVPSSTVMKTDQSDFCILKREKTVDLDSLDPYNKRRFKNLITNKVQFISGTMSPPPSSDTSLENMESALRFYKNHGVHNVCIQPKMMGSRFQVYLHAQPELCYGFTRNGFLYHNPDLYDEYARLIKRFQHLFDDGLQCRIMDCELLPWRLLGKNLIDKSFKGIHSLISTEVEYADKQGFYQALQELDGSLPSDLGTMSKDVAIEKYGHHVYDSYRSYKSIAGSILPIESERKYLAQYQEQVDLYGSDGKIEIWPFSILKDVYENDEIIYGDGCENSKLFREVNDTSILVCTVDEIEKATSFFNDLVTTNKQEGAVVKPELVMESDVPPYIKVRNSEYLRLVYGYDYTAPTKLQKLISRKQINRKITESIHEFGLGMKLLRTPCDELNNNNTEYQQLVARFLDIQSKNTDLDPRL